MDLVRVAVLDGEGVAHPRDLGPGAARVEDPEGRRLVLLHRERFQGPAEVGRLHPLLKTKAESIIIFLVLSQYVPLLFSCLTTGSYF